MDRQDDVLSLVLFSGTDDKLNSAGVLAVGAAAMGRKVNGFLQYWALDAFRADRVHELVQRQGTQHWSELFSQAKEIGEVGVHACSLSMEMFGITKDDLDPLVDDVEGVAAFIAAADGSVTFI